MELDPSHKYMLSIEEVATMLGLPSSTTYQYAARGKLPFKVERLGRSIRVRRADVEEYLSGKATA